MSKRVLACIKEGKTLKGFRIVDSKKGVLDTDLSTAQTLYKEEKFDNVELNGVSWKGTEVGLNKLPVMDTLGNFTRVNGRIIVLSKVKKDGETTGFVLMNLDGKVSTQSIDDTFALLSKYGPVNVKVIKPTTGKPYISGIRQEIKVIDPNKKAPLNVKPKPTPAVQSNSGQTQDAAIARIRKLVPLLNKAAKAYYVHDKEIMSNHEYDALADELEALEKKTGFVMSNSPSINVGYQVQSKLPKVKHPKKMLSLDKTKNISELSKTIKGRDGFLGWKLDGLTVVATYEKGVLVRAITRGNGEIGEDITNNYKVFANVPLRINTLEKITVRGEALISYKTFETINSKLPKGTAKYKNPRNLSSGSARHLDTKVTAQRSVRFVVFQVVEGLSQCNKYTEKLEKVKDFGFEIVGLKKVNSTTLTKAMKEFESAVSSYPYPVDGLVLTVDDIKKGEALGVTGKFPKNAKAFKWRDEEEETSMLYIDWSNSRTGAINPVAVFNPVNLEGTRVRRASVHNLTILEGLKLGKGDIISVYKANMIIPQISKNKTQSGTLVPPPKTCPICSAPTEIKVSKPKHDEPPTKTLYCTGQDCPAKKLGSLAHFVKRDAMNIEGLSESTLEMLVSAGVVHTYRDIYRLKKHGPTITALSGYGVKAYNKLINAIETSRDVDLNAFIYALGIEHMGRTTSKLVCDAFNNDLSQILSATPYDFKSIAGLGSKTIQVFTDYMAKNAYTVAELAQEMRFTKPVAVNTNSPISGKVFCVTGSVNHYLNRKELQQEIEQLGGKISSSVSSKTDYLINNDINSTSSKNTKASTLGVPIISEDAYRRLIGK